jgi:hypothetical protein
MLISGVPEIDPDEFAKHVVYQGRGYSRDHPVIELFFEVFGEFTNEERGKLLAFVTGACRVPAEGFASYKNDGHPFTISGETSVKRLPSSHICDRVLELPPYETKEVMKEKLLWAMSPDSDGFHNI